MKLLLLTSTVLLVSCGSTTQVTQTRHRQGPPKESYEYYVNSRGDTVRTGTYQSWHGNGSRRIEGHYDNDRFDSTWRYWDTDGELQAEANWADGRMHGRYFNATVNKAELDADLRQVIELGAFGDSSAMRAWYRGQLKKGMREGRWGERRHKPLEEDSIVLWHEYGDCVHGQKTGRWIAEARRYRADRAIDDILGCSTFVYDAGVLLSAESCLDSVQHADSVLLARKRDAQRRWRAQELFRDTCHSLPGGMVPPVRNSYRPVGKYVFHTACEVRTPLGIMVDTGLVLEYNIVASDGRRMMRSGRTRAPLCECLDDSPYEKTPPPWAKRLVADSVRIGGDTLEVFTPLDSTLCLGGIRFEMWSDTILLTPFTKAAKCRETESKALHGIVIGLPPDMPICVKLRGRSSRPVCVSRNP